LNVRELVVALENAVIAYVAELGLRARSSRAAPGVYLDGAKLASVGLRIRRGASYHGLALNVSLDLRPFERINVCGHRGLAVTRLADHVGRFAGIAATAAVDAAADGLVPHLLRELKYDAGYSAINTAGQAVNSR
jgi:lipoyl(octanoyl) transferase